MLSKKLLGLSFVFLVTIPLTTEPDLTSFLKISNLTSSLSNISVKSFICDSFKKNYLKIKVVTGKGHRSTIKKNPYISSELGILKNSVPEFIKNDKDISDKIYKIYKINCNSKYNHNCT